MRRFLPFLLLLVLGGLSLGWGTAADLRYKIKPADGNLWADRYGWGLPIRGGRMEGGILFTFDDGPSHETTPALLDLLDRYGVKAVFFVTGHRIDGSKSDAVKNRETLLETFRRGHLIGNHSYLHTRLTDLPLGRVRWELNRTSTLVEQVTGVRPRLMRPPYGPRATPELLQLIASLGYTQVLWSVDTLDWMVAHRQRTASRAIDLIQKQNGGVVLLHDTHVESVEAFPLIMDWILRENADGARAGRSPYRLIGLEELYVPRRARRSRAASAVSLSSEPGSSSAQAAAPPPSPPRRSSRGRAR